jgi:GNAT superfamily N-acetyltransferase
MQREGRTVACAMKRKICAGPPSEEASEQSQKSSQKLIREASRMSMDVIGSTIARFAAGDSAFLRSGTAKDVGTAVIQACFDLLKSNMEMFYKAAWSWNDSVKMKELQSPGARIISLWQDSKLPSPLPPADSLGCGGDSGADDAAECDVAGDDSGWETEDDAGEGSLHAFAHYRFCTEEGILSSTSTERLPVLYIWEMQVSERCRGRGLGRMLMDMLSAIASAASMHSLVLTVFSSNKPAIAFYKHMGFDHTMDCPSRSQCDSPHFILSKKVAPPESS